MNDLLPYLVIGIANGSIYAIAGMGLVLTYRTSGVFNFAHGAQAAVAGYVMYDFWVVRGWPWPLAAGIAMLVAGVIGGLLLERLGRGLAAAPTSGRIVATVGLLIGLQAALVMWKGAAAKTFRPFLPQGVVSVAGTNVRMSQIIVAALAVAAAVGMWIFLNRTRRGIATQAVVNDPALLALRGTSPLAVRRSAWVIGSCFAAASGILLAPTLGLDVTVLVLLVVQAFGAAAVGAFYSLGLTYAGGIGIGVGQALLTKWVTAHPSLIGLPPTLPFLVLLVVLVAMPRHKLLDRSPLAVRPSGGRIRRPGARQISGAVGVVAFLSMVPAVVGTRTPLYTNALVFVVLFASLGLLVRVSGQISLCHMAFAATGAVAFAHAHEAGVPWVGALLAGGLVAVPIGAAVAVPAIRLSGVYLAIATFGLGILIERVFFPQNVMFGTYLRRSAPRPRLAGLDSDVGYYFVVLAVAIACVTAVYLVSRARLGRLLRALADSPTALAAHGTNPNVSRTLVFCLSAFLAGIAGALAGPITGVATGPTFGFQYSLLLLAVLTVAGNAPTLSPFIAAALYVVLPGYVQSDTIQNALPLLFGVAAVVASVAPVDRLGRALNRSKRVRDREHRSPVTERRQLATARDLASPALAHAVPGGTA